MNDEIKYWLEGLDDLSYKKVIDYITNLQQENERLKKIEYEFIDDSGDNASFTLENYLDIGNKLYDCERELEDYKSRCEKAIGYINKYCIDDEFYINLSNKEKAIIEVLNILQNGDNDDTRQSD